MKVSQVEKKFFFMRKWDNIDYTILEKNIIDSDEYKTMLSDDDIERVTNNLVKLIQKVFDEQAPLIKMKIKEKNNDVLTRATKIMIDKKNKAYKTFKDDNNKENEKQFKILAAVCRKLIFKDKKDNIKKHVETHIKNPKSIWKTA